MSRNCSSDRSKFRRTCCVALVSRGLPLEDLIEMTVKQPCCVTLVGQVVETSSRQRRSSYDRKGKQRPFYIELWRIDQVEEQINVTPELRSVCMAGVLIDLLNADPPRGG